MKFFTRLILMGCIVLSLPAWAETKSPGKAPSSAELVRLSWKASNEQKLDQVKKLHDLALDAYGQGADALAAQLNAFPARDQMDQYQLMNDVAVVMFVYAEALMHDGKTEEAVKAFEAAMSRFPWSQSFDPSRGSFWSIKEKSQASISIIKGETPEDKELPKPKAPSTLPVLAFPGKEKVVDYFKYGRFDNEGKNNFHFHMLDQKGLVEAVGEGIYPNLTDIYKNPEYKKALQDGRLEGNHWDYVNSPDLQAAFFKWASAPEPWGVRLFYLGVIFEKAKMYYEAIKCYQALIIHFPNTIAWTYWQTPWYPGQAAISKIKHIIRMNPDLHLQFEGAKIRIEHSYDNDPKNDITSTSPGRLRLLSEQEYNPNPVPAQINLGKPVKNLGRGKVRLVKYASGHWQLLVGKKPYIIKGITYFPTKVGQSPDKGTMKNWMLEDDNANGIVDAPFEAFMDKNMNNQQDADEPTVGDFALMKEMGVNTIRLYHHPHKPVKEVLRKMYKDHGIMVIMGDFLGKYAIGSGAAWSEGTDYENPLHKKMMMQSVKDIVMEYKNEPYILMWLLGNENNYGVASNADKKPEAYFKFVNEVARMIKKLDPNHPVAVCNGDTLFLDKFGKFAPEVDAYAGNVYRGDYGFGSFWQQVAEAADRPAFISEYGAPAHAGGIMSYEDAKKAQSAYHLGNWVDILENSAGYKDGIGNSIGGVAFEWLDEWWKNYEPAKHDVKADVVGPFPGGFYYEEWFGVLGQGDGSKTPYLREPRDVYYTYKELWNR